MARLTVKKSSETLPDGAGAVYVLSGSLAEGAAASLRAGTSGAPALCVFDWDAVILASSDGLREWIDFLRAFAPSRSIVFRRCRPAIVTSFNLVPACTNGVAVSSLYGAFICPECQKEHDALLQVGKDVSAATGLTRVVTCAWCGNAEAELNLPEDDFFRILGPG